MLLLVLATEAILLTWDNNFRSIDSACSFSITTYSSVTCIIQIIMMPECCVACNLAFHKAKGIHMISVLWAPTVNSTGVSTLSSSCTSRFVTVDEEIGIG